ncbi:MAG: metallophosphoesterase [Gemmatimonadota bacterium]
MRFIGLLTASFLLLYAVALTLLAGLNRSWWRDGRVRRSARWTPVAAAACGLVWLAGVQTGCSWVVAAGSGGLAALFVYLIALILAFTVTGPLQVVAGLLARVRAACSGGASQGRLQATGGPTSPSRRTFLRTALTAVPAATCTVATGGLLGTAARARLPQIPLAYPHLPPELDGLRILHVSDIHVGAYVSIADVEHLARRAAALAPDLVLVTGDICDDMARYLDTLRILEGLSPRLGAYASLGNHEHYRGLREVRRAFDRTTMPLLVDEGVALPVGGAQLYLAGADDPRYMGGPESHERLHRSVTRSLEGAPAGAFRLLMSHRSVAFQHAGELAVDLTLSGHTHGFQLGIDGRSLFEAWLPDRYLWGHYRQGDRQLYTSSGVGHWFPFRLGCPAEAPLLVLERA